MRFFQNLVLITILLLVGACREVLELEPIGLISENAVWNDRDLVDAYVTNLYAPREMWNDPFADFQSRMNVISDEARTAFGWSTLFNVFPYGIINPQNTANRDYMDFWWIYPEIRRQNEFFVGIADSELDEEFIEQRTAEVRVIRAWCYFNLAMRYGGTPLITEPQGLEEDLLVERTPEADIYTFIMEELDAAIGILPEEYNFDEAGRISRGMALAFKSRAALYAGSIARYGTVSGDGLLGVPAGLADDYFQASYDAANELINSGTYSLFRQFPNPAVNYQRLFQNPLNEESIFVKRYDPSNPPSHSFDYYNQPIGYKPFVASVTNPYLELVDDYEFRDGSPGSSVNYNVCEPLTVKYANKDPRFHATILYDGAFWIDDTIRTYYFTVENDLTDQRRNGPAFRGAQVNDRNAGATQTGFLLKKYLAEERGLRVDQSNQDFIVFRLGEVYLNRAEAAFELGNTAEALSSVNIIRERAGMPAHGSIDTEKIRRERRVELAFESLRFWDLKRWRVATDELSGVFNRLRPYRVASTGETCYLIENAHGNRVREFRAEHYYVPIWDGHLIDNPNLTQNPGY